MATYTKKLKTLAVHLMLDSEVVNIADTVDNDMATRALNEFKKYDTMHYESESGGQKVTNAIPYHAVQYIEVTEADGSVEREDPYGCDEAIETVTLTVDEGDTVQYYTECGADPQSFEDTLVIAKGTTLYFPNNTGVWETYVNNEPIEETGRCVPYTFNEDATIHQIMGE